MIVEQYDTWADFVSEWNCLPPLHLSSLQSTLGRAQVSAVGGAGEKWPDEEHTTLGRHRRTCVAWPVQWSGSPWRGAGPKAAARRPSTAHGADTMTGSLGANAVGSSEGADPAVNIEETCQQAADTQTLGCCQSQNSEDCGAHTIVGGQVTKQGPRRGSQKRGARQIIQSYNCDSQKPRTRPDQKKFE